MSRRIVSSDLSLSPGGKLPQSGAEASSSSPTTASISPLQPRHLQNNLPPWMSSSVPSVNLSLSPSSSAPRSPPAAALAKLCMELEEGRQAWAQHKKEAAWRLSRLEQQLEAEKTRKRKEVSDEVEAKIRCLREEEMAFLERLEVEYKDQLSSIQREAEGKEAKMAESWTARHAKLARLAEQVAAGTHHFAMNKQHLR